MPSRLERDSHFGWEPAFTGIGGYRMGPLQARPGVYFVLETPYDTGLWSPLDTPDEGTFLALEAEMEKYIISSEALDAMAAEYSKILNIFAGNGDLSEEDLHAIGRHYNQLTMLDHEFSYSGSALVSYAWALAHVVAQRRAILGMNSDMGSQNGKERAGMVTDELDAYELTHLSPELAEKYPAVRQAYSRRREILTFWHSAWLDQGYLVKDVGVFQADGIAITRRDVEASYRNFLPVPWISIEGLDRSGKDTQGVILQRYLSDVLGWNVLPQNFPTDLRIGDMIRAALRGEIGFDNQTMQKLFQADRADWMSDIKEGIACLLTVRHSATGIAYGSESYSYKDIIQQIIENKMLGWADLTIMIDTPVDECLRRVKGKPEMYEKRDKLLVARENYLTLLDVLPNFVRIDGMGEDGLPKSPDELFREVVEMVVTCMPDEKLPQDQKGRLIQELEPWIASQPEIFII